MFTLYIYCRHTYLPTYYHMVIPTIAIFFLCIKTYEASSAYLQFSLSPPPPTAVEEVIPSNWRKQGNSFAFYYFVLAFIIVYFIN